MTPLAKHIILPAISPLAIVGLYFAPKAVFGCANRGLLAVGIVLVSTGLALWTTIRFVREKKRSEAAAVWWLRTTVVLLLPVLLLFGPLG